MALRVRIVLFVFLGCAPAMAQEDLIAMHLPFGLGGQGPAGGAVSTLLRMRDVRSDLGLSDRQVRELRALFVESSRNRRTFFRNLIDGKIFDEPLGQHETRQVLDLYNQRWEKSLLNVLSDAQIGRLRQLTLQLQGVDALRNEEVAAALQLDEHQIQRIEDKIGKLNTKLTNREKTLQRFNGEVSVLLSSHQRALWKTMNGQPFAFTELRQRLRDIANSPKRQVTLEKPVGTLF